MLRREFHIRHVATGLKGVGLEEPGVEVFRRVGGNTCAERLADGEFRQIRAEDALGTGLIAGIIQDKGEIYDEKQTGKA